MFQSWRFLLGLVWHKKTLVCQAGATGNRSLFSHGPLLKQETHFKWADLLHLQSEKADRMSCMIDDMCHFACLKTLTGWKDNQVQTISTVNQVSLSYQKWLHSARTPHRRCWRGRRWGLGAFGTGPADGLAGYPKLPGAQTVTGTDLL